MNGQKMSTTCFIIIIIWKDHFNPNNLFFPVNWTFHKYITIVVQHMFLIFYGIEKIYALYSNVSGISLVELILGDGIKKW